MRKFHLIIWDYNYEIIHGQKKIVTSKNVINVQANEKNPKWIRDVKEFLEGVSDLTIAETQFYRRC